MLKTSIEEGITDYEIVQRATDSTDRRPLERYFPELKFFKAEENTDIRIIKIKLKYTDGKPLKTAGYMYSTIEKCWTKELSKKEVRVEAEKILKFISKEHITISTKTGVEFQVYKTFKIKLPDTDIKRNKIMKDMGTYKYNNISNCWEKSLKSENFNQEVFKLIKLGITENFFI